MGNKFMSKVLAVFVAVAVMMTSAIGVFAAGSPEEGAKPAPTAPTGQAVLTNTYGLYNKGTMDISFTPVSGADSYNVIINGKTVQNITGTSLTLSGFEKNAFYDIQIQALAGNKAGAPSALANRTLSKRWFKNITKVKVKKGKSQGQGVSHSKVKEKCKSPRDNKGHHRQQAIQTEVGIMRSRPCFDQELSLRAIWTKI